MGRDRIEIGEDINKPLLYISLLLIWGGSVLSSRFDYWGTIIGGAVLAVLGCYLNMRCIKWVKTVKNGQKGVYIKEEGNQ